MSGSRTCLIVASLFICAATLTALPSLTKEENSKTASQAGKLLFEKNTCVTCHTAAGHGGCLGPPLDGIAARRSKTFILTRITDEPGEVEKFQRLYGQAELMPHPRVPSENAKLITAYLLTLPPPAGGFRVGSHGKADQQEANKQGTLDKSVQTTTKQDLAAESVLEGKRLFYDHGCISCHALGKLGGKLAPRLDGIADRYDRDYVSKRMANAEQLNLNFPDEYQARGFVMPPSNLTPQEIKKIADFLMWVPAQR